MKAELYLRQTYQLDEYSFVELVIWRLPRPLAGSPHAFKYRLAYVEQGKCLIRYDNEAGKGDHRHIGRRETPYAFSDPEGLLADFWTDVDTRRRQCRW